MSSRSVLTEAELADWLVAHQRWRVEDGRLVCEYTLAYDRAVAVLAATEATVASLDHHPRVTLEYNRLVVETWTHDRSALTGYDIELAAAFDGAVDASS